MTNLPRPPRHPFRASVRLVGAALALAASAGCSDSAPAEPTWADVAPILASSCVRCHGAPALVGAPPTFRLDRYDDTRTAAGLVLGASSMAEWIALRVRDGSMPPRFPLADYDVDVLANWAKLRTLAPLAGPPRGPARPDNAAPRLTLSAARVPDGIELGYELRDPDRDLVVGELQATLGNRVVELGEVHSGRGTLLLDTALLPEGLYTLTSILDDGAGPTRGVAGEVMVTPPRPAPPRVRLRAPAQGDYVSAAELPLAVEISADDADTAQLSVTVSLRDDRAPETPLDTQVVSLAAGASQLVSLGAADTPEGLTYRVVAEISDGAATHRVQSGRFRVSRETTTDTFQVIADQIFAPYCLACHSSAQRIPNLALDLSKYTGTAAAPGAYDARQRIFQRAILAQSMPPGSARANGGALPPAQRDRLARWLLAGAPQ
ncbi:MAG: hypothetical protein R3B48_18825 [Kofleriaceae bacterium]